MIHPPTRRYPLNPYHRRALERIAAMPGGMLAYGAVAIAQDALHAAAYGDRGPCPHCAPLEHASAPACPYCAPDEACALCAGQARAAALDAARGVQESPATPQTEGAHLAVEKTGAENAGARSGNDERAAQLEREHAGRRSMIHDS